MWCAGPPGFRYSEYDSAEIVLTFALFAIAAAFLTFTLVTGFNKKKKVLRIACVAHTMRIPIIRLRVPIIRIRVPRIRMRGPVIEIHIRARNCTG